MCLFIVDGYGTVLLTCFWNMDLCLYRYFYVCKLLFLLIYYENVIYVMCIYIFFLCCSSLSCIYLL